MYCFDTDVLSATVAADPPLHLIRPLACTPPTAQCTTAITLGELVNGVHKRGSPQLAERAGDLIASARPSCRSTRSRRGATGSCAPSWSARDSGSQNRTCASPQSRSHATPRSSPATAGTSPASPSYASRTGPSTNRLETRVDGGDPSRKPERGETPAGLSARSTPTTSTGLQRLRAGPAPWSSTGGAACRNPTSARRVRRARDRAWPGSAGRAPNRSRAVRGAPMPLV